jgi:hypothetical protein
VKEVSLRHVAAANRQGFDHGVRTPEKTVVVFEFSLCLSRACLGKMFVFIFKWLKHAVFSHNSHSFRCARACGARSQRRGKGHAINYSSFSSLEPPPPPP